MYILQYLKQHSKKKLWLTEFRKPLKLYKSCSFHITNNNRINVTMLACITKYEYLSID